MQSTKKVAFALRANDWGVSLNFETNAIIYDETVARSLRGAFEKDPDVCPELTFARYTNRSSTVKVNESISRLFSACARYHAYFEARYESAFS